MNRLNHHRNILPLVFLLVLGGAAFIYSCSGGTEIGNPQCSRYSTDADLAAYLKDQYAQSAQPSELWRLDNDVPPGWLHAEIYAGEKGYADADVQEADENECDQVKTDGTYFYVAADQEVRIVSAIPANDMRLVGKIAINGHVDSLYLHKKTLVVLYVPKDGQGASWMYDDKLKTIDVGMPYWKPVQAKFGILMADISHPQEPQIIKHIEIEGYLAASRLVRGKLHLISQFIPDLPSLTLWYDGSAQDKEEAIQSNAKALASLSLDDLLPFYTRYDANGTWMQSGRLVEVADCISPQIPAGGTIVTVVVFDLADPYRDFDVMGFIADIHHVYVSARNIYLISTMYQPEPDIKTNEGPDRYQTRIYQLDISRGNPVFSAQGTVDGHILNQFSINEFNNTLRIAVTTGKTTDGTAANHIYCLNKKDGALNMIGRLENIALGQRLYSARFMGNRGFLVFFEECAPLLILDLSDSKAPALAGELKVPGYSTYLKLLGDHYLLAIGKAPVCEPRTSPDEGLILSLFDIGNIYAPELRAVKKIGDKGAVSEVFWNHKALSFLPEKNLFSLPVGVYETPNEYPSEPEPPPCNSLYVYRIDDFRLFKTMGQMAMTVAEDGTGSLPWMRGIFMNNVVYAVSADRITAAPIDAIAAPFFTVNLAEK